MDEVGFYGIFSSLKKSRFLKLMLLVNFLIQYSLNRKKIVIKIIFWHYFLNFRRQLCLTNFNKKINRYYSTLLSRLYYLVPQYLIFISQLNTRFLRKIKIYTDMFWFLKKLCKFLSYLIFWTKH